MKYLISLLTIALLASCGAKNTETKPTNSGTSSTNTEINNILMGNSGAVLKGIKISYLDEEEKNIHFEVNIELSKRNVI